MPAPAQAVEVTNYYAPSDGHVVLCSVATRNADGSRTWYANVKDEVEGRERAEQVKIMLDMNETAPITTHEVPATFLNLDYVRDELASEPVGSSRVLPNLKASSWPQESREEAHIRSAEALDRLLGFGDLIDGDSLATPDDRLTLYLAYVNDDVALANPSNSQTLYRLTESGRRFLSKFSPVGRV